MVNNKVTVCICTLNRAKNLRKAISHIFLQSYKNLELIVVNDGSSDNTEAELAILNQDYPELIVQNNSTNLGLAKARNVALSLATGKWFTFIDDDDLWEPMYLDRMVSELIRKGAVACFSGVITKTSMHFFSGEYMTIQSALLQGITPPVGAQMYSTKLLKELGGYDETIKTGVDHDLWISIAANKEYQSAKCVFASFALVTPDAISNPNAIKMTQNVDKRITGIQRSLTVWDSKLVSIGGEPFRDYFFEEYRFYLFRRFVMHGLRNRDFELLGKAITHPWLSPQKAQFLSRFIQYIWTNKILRKRTPLKQFGTYKN